MDWRIRNAIAPPAREPNSAPAGTIFRYDKCTDDENSAADEVCDDTDLKGEHRVASGQKDRQHDAVQPDEHPACLQAGRDCRQAGIPALLGNAAVVVPKPAVEHNDADHNPRHHDAEYRGVFHAKGADQDGDRHNNLGKAVEEYADGGVEIRFFEQRDFNTRSHKSSPLIFVSKLAEDAEKRETAEPCKRVDVRLRGVIWCS